MEVSNKQKLINKLKETIKVISKKDDSLEHSWKSVGIMDFGTTKIVVQVWKCSVCNKCKLEALEIINPKDVVIFEKRDRRTNKELGLR